MNSRLRPQSRDLVFLVRKLHAVMTCSASDVRDAKAREYIIEAHELAEHMRKTIWQQGPRRKGSSGDKDGN